MRTDGRLATQLRPLKITPDYSKHPLSSVLVESGATKVLCSLSIEDQVPGWMRAERQQRGWLTAEYSMLPASTHTRSKRERNQMSGRTQEIQRLIGRSVRGAIDLSKCPDMTLLLDCDVLQADGGTRTASITGAYSALRIGVDRLLREGRLKQDPLHEQIAATSVGLLGGEILLDLDYLEDSTAALDMNIVLTRSGKILELQGSAERAAFSKEQVVQIIDLASSALPSVFAIQDEARERSRR